MAIKDINRVQSVTQPIRRKVTDVRLPDPGLLTASGDLCFVQIAYALGDSGEEAQDGVTSPARTLGHPLGVPSFRLDHFTGSTSGAPKIPPTTKLLPPGAPPLPIAAPALVGTIAVPGGRYVVDVLIQVREA